MVTSVLKDGKNEIFHLEKNVIMASTGASGKGRLKHFHDSSGCPLSPCCQHVSSGREIKLPSDLAWRAEGEPCWETTARLGKGWPKSSLVRPWICLSCHSSLLIPYRNSASALALFWQLWILLILGDDQENLKIQWKRKRQKTGLHVWGNF